MQRTRACASVQAPIESRVHSVYRAVHGMHAPCEPHNSRPCRIRICSLAVRAFATTQSYRYCTVVQMCITKGLSHAKAASVMCMQYFSIVISQAAGMLLFGEFLTWQADIGMALVVGSMVFYMWWEARARKQRRSG
jgi:hypothetical protein